jgi:alkanesulfonate monooxygenase SsuD/methylene tetrahydromethanopterin reductase-like flavin-dependent oxidoreductase (luciferase family)
MEAGVHLPQLDLDGAGLSRERVFATVDAARDAGFAAVSANDHFAFHRPWLDGLTLLSVVAERAGGMDLMTSVALPTLRGPVPLVSAATAIDALAEGRVVLGVAAGSSRADYDALGVPFDQRWQRFDDAAATVRSLLTGAPSTARTGRSSGVSLWVGSWGSDAGLRRVVRWGDGWLASAYNTDPERFARARATLEAPRSAVGGAAVVGGAVVGGAAVGGAVVGGAAGPFPHALVTMWTWVTDRAGDADRRLSDIAGVVRRDPRTLTGRLCIGSPETCAEVLSRYAAVGCRRVHFWPLGDERAQIERLAAEVLPLITTG